MDNSTSISLNAPDSILQVKQRYQIPITGVVHIGASVGQEVTAYAKSGASPVLYVEPLPAAFEILSRRVAEIPGHRTVRAFCSDRTGCDVAFHVSSNQGLSSSALPLGRHATLYPDVSYVETITVQTVRLDDLLFSQGYNPGEFSYLNIDVQGTELDVLRGAPNLLSNVLAIQIEVSVEPLYEGGCTLEQVAAVLKEAGFSQALVQINPKGWGEALYLRRWPISRAARPGVARIFRAPRDRTKPESTFLLKHRRRVKSQLGEDGILAAIFAIIGLSSRWCVEATAGDGLDNSNVYPLWHDEGWHACLVEADKELLDRLRNNVAGYNNVRVIEGGLGNIDPLLRSSELPDSYDLLSLDVGGNEWEVWDSHFLFRPRVVCVGFNPSFPNDVYFAQAQNSNVRHGSSLLALIALGKKKGYELAAVTEWNAIFVKSEDFEKLKIADNSIDSMHAEGERFTSSFYQLYDGTLGLVGCDSLIWRRKKLAAESLQVIPNEERSPFSRVAVIPASEFERASQRPKLFLTPTGGLVNRLMAVLSCMRLAELFRRDLYLEWPRTHALNCDWHDLFSTQIPGFSSRVDTTHIPESHRFNLDASRINAEFPTAPVLDLSSATSDVHVVTNCFIGHSLEDRGTDFWNYTESVRDVSVYIGRLALSRSVQETLDDFLQEHGPLENVVGLHVRRGFKDSPHSQAYFGALSDYAYLLVLEALNDEKSKVFLASDSLETREYLKKRLGGQLLSYTPRSLDKDSDHEAIQDALVDFLLLSMCRMVVGLHGSSFAYFASQIHCIPYFELSNPNSKNEIRIIVHSYRDAFGQFHCSTHSRTMKLPVELRLSK